MSNSIDKHRLIYITNCRGVVCVFVHVCISNLAFDYVG